MTEDSEITEVARSCHMNALQRSFNLATLYMCSCLDKRGASLNIIIDYRATYLYGIGNGRAPPIGLHGNTSETIPRIHSAREDFDAAAPTTEVSSLVVATSSPGKLIDHINVVSWYNCTALCPV